MRQSPCFKSRKMADPVSSLLNESVLIATGARVVAIIQARVLRGEFLPGSTGSSQYSETAAPLPYAALERVVGEKTIKSMIEAKEVSRFTSGSGRVWMLLQGGYKKLRELSGKQADHVVLTWTGGMLKDLSVRKVTTSPPGIVVSFSNARSNELAGYHDREGAGKRHVTNRFMGLTDAEISELGAYIKSLIKFQ
jgi:hypothetical protein